MGLFLFHERGFRKNLNWFFNNWFYTNNYIDLKIAGASQMNDLLTVNIDNVGGFVIPFQQKSPMKTEQRKSFISRLPSGKRPKTDHADHSYYQKVQSINLDSGIFMDYTPDDNKKTL